MQTGKHEWEQTKIILPFPIIPFKVSVFQFFLRIKKLSWLARQQERKKKKKAPQPNKIDLKIFFLTLLLLSSISFSSPTAFAAKLSAAEEKFVDDGLSLALVVEKRNQG